MNVVVFGGSGFLGSHVADVLTERGHTVTIFDITSSPYLRPEQKMIVGDILDSTQVNTVVKGADYVYNFAGFSSLEAAKDQPVETARLNIMGNLTILEACRTAHVKRYMYASTVYVYSQRGGFYRCSKQASETYIEEYHRCYNLNYTILRYGTLYGPRADKKNSIYNYLAQALQKKEIHARGNGEEIREYINVKDAAQLSVDILADKHANQHIIITGHNPLKYKDMLMMIKEILGNKVTISFDTATNIDHYAYTPYSFIPKIGTKLVSNQYVDMGQGLLECLQEMHTHINKKNKKTHG